MVEYGEQRGALTVSFEASAALDLVDPTPTRWRRRRAATQTLATLSAEQRRMSQNSPFNEPNSCAVSTRTIPLRVVEVFSLYNTDSLLKPSSSRPINPSSCVEAGESSELESECEHI